MIRGLGLRGAIAVNVITMIGIGPLITIPLVLAQLHGSLALAAWIGGALIALCDGLIWAELASLYPGSGGTYVFLLETFGRERWGRLLAFLFTWQTVLSVPLILATGYIGFAQYSGYLFPALQSDTFRQGIVAAGVGIVTLALLYRPIGAIAATSFVLAAVAFASVGAVIAAASTRFNLAQALAYDHSMPLQAALLAGLGPALVITLYDYYGYAQACMLGDEVREPKRTLPRSIVISVLGIAALYVALQAGVLGVVRWQELVPATAGGATPAAANYVASTVIERTLGSWPARVATLAILVTAFASTFGNLLGASRIPYAAAVDGVFLKPFASLTRSGRFPNVALLTLGLLALPACFFSLGNVIAALTAATVIVQNLAQVAILFVLRSRGVIAPYRMTLFPLPALIACAGWIYIFFSSGEAAIAYGILTLAAGVALFAIRARLRREWPFALKAAALLALVAGLALGARVPAEAAWGSSAIVERRGNPVFTVDGKPFFVYGAAFFYERLPPDRWDPSMRALRALGINTLDLYVPWNWHELSDDEFDFDGHTNPRRDLHEVLRLAREFGFRIILRPGPVIRNEWRNGGYPAWLLARPEYGMPVHDLLEGRYPPTATLQNAHSDDAAAQWLANATHRYYAKRWLERALHEFEPVSDLVIAIALDDDQGAYIDNQTWPAPHFQAYLGWLAGIVHGVTGPRVPLFINTYQMKVTASSPVWAMGNWYQSDAYLLGEHDRAQLEFSNGLLQTRPHQPVMISEFQAGWLEQPGDIRPRPADPSNTLLAVATMLGQGARGVVNFPAQDTLYPAGMEAPFANAFYAWDAALGLDGAVSARYFPTAALGHFLASFGTSLAASEPVSDLAVAYTTSAYGHAPNNDAIAQIAQRTIEVQQACRALSLACRLVDLRYASPGALRRFPLVAIPSLPAGTIAGTFSPDVMLKLAHYAHEGGHVATIRAGADTGDLARALSAAHIVPAVSNAPGASLARSHDGQVEGYLFVPNFEDHEVELSDVVVRLPGRGPLRIAQLRVPARDFVLSPLGLRVHPFDKTFAAMGAQPPVLAYTDCPIEVFGSNDAIAAPMPAPSPSVPLTVAPSPAAPSSAPPSPVALRYVPPPGTPVCGVHFTSGDSVAFYSRPLPLPNSRPIDGIPVRRDVFLPQSHLDDDVPAGQAIVRRDDVYREGSKAVVLENALVRIVIAPNAGARAFVFEDKATRTSIFTTVGALRDDLIPEPPLSTSDRIAKYTHQFPAGMFNRPYDVTLLASGTRAEAGFRYEAPDAYRPGDAPSALRAATFARTVTLEPGARAFDVDESVAFQSAGTAADAARGVSVSSLAVGDALDMKAVVLLTPEASPFAGNRSDAIAGNAFGLYDTSTKELATVAWRSGDIENAQALEQQFSVVVRLTLTPGGTRHMRYGYERADSLDAARAALAAAEKAAQGHPAGLAKNAR